ncbi:hypothetical protein V8G54_001347, partial [Vigna mungo]
SSSSPSSSCSLAQAPTSPTTNSPGNGAATPAKLVSTIIFSFPFSVSSRQFNSVVLTKRSRDIGVSAMAVKSYLNKDDIAIKKRQSGVNELADLVRVKLGPKGRNVVLESKCGSPKMVNDGVTVTKEVEVEDAVRNMGAKLVRQAAAKIDDLAGRHRRRRHHRRSRPMTAPTANSGKMVACACWKDKPPSKETLGLWVVEQKRGEVSRTPP